MAEKPSETASKRLPVTPSTFDKIRDFSRGLDASYDEAIQYLLSLAVQPKEEEMFAGRRLRDAFSTFKKAR